jgi:hypothetical protein
MAKKILAIIAGVITGFIIVFIGDATVHAINPPPLGLNYMDKNVMMNYVANIPVYVLVIMCIFWLLSAFTGGLVASVIRKSEWRFCALVTGGILLAAAILNLALVPHPIWMWAVALIGYLPMALLGGSLVRRKKTIHTGTTL